MNKHEEARKNVLEYEHLIYITKTGTHAKQARELRTYIAQSEATEKELEELKTQLSAYFKHHDNWVACIEDGYPDSLLAEQTKLSKVGEDK